LFISRKRFAPPQLHYHLNMNGSNYEGEVVNICDLPDELLLYLFEFIS